MRKHILIVDDAKEVVDLVQAMLEGQGYQVITASNGIEGLKTAFKELPLLIIADVLMPEMDGFIFFKELRKNPMTAKIPVLILTARAKMEDSFRAMGVEGFLSKPIDATSLLAEVAREMSAFIKAQDKLDDTIETPQTVEDLTETKKPVLVFHRAASTPRERKAIVYGYEQSVVKEMCKHLEGKIYRAFAIEDEDRLPEEVDRIDPDIILLEMNPGSPVPLEEVLMSINAVVKKKEMESLENRHSVAIILYKVHHAVSGVSTIASDMADTSSLLKACEDVGYSKYIGLYSPFTFLMKIKDFL